MKNIFLATLFLVIFTTASQGQNQGQCDPSYPDVCIPPPPPDLDCKDLTDKNIRVEGDDPHKLDRDGDGIACKKD